MNRQLITFIIVFLFFTKIKAQHSIAREWNEILLEHIRDDFARPTVHARNLFHSSMLMYDAWAIFQDGASTVFLGNNFGNYDASFEGIAFPESKEGALQEIISYGMYRFLEYRFPNASTEVKQSSKDLFVNLGYDTNFISIDYSTNSYAALGNYLASELIAFGLNDGANEVNDYANQFYEPVNEPMNPYASNINTAIDPNRWQPLTFSLFIDQSGNEVNGTPEFVGAEWGKVIPFALTKDNESDPGPYNDPGPPCYIQNSESDGIEDPFKWNFSLVLSWSAHLDPTDETYVDISPRSIGNILTYPETYEEYKQFYNFSDGGDWGSGHKVNPQTNMPYEPQIVKRADYARVLAEFWADGPDSETPPGHWFTIFNYVADHELTEKRINGIGDPVPSLEWDVKGYLALGAAMHDAAICTWGIKGYYDYIRPISAIRYMAAMGQSTDNTLTNFNPHGLPLIEGLVEVIETGDELAGDGDINLGKLKVKTWRGPEFINDPALDTAKVDWILATEWWSYQRPTFVTPPFAGYLSGHSTFSSAAAKVLELFTGDAFFPGGLGTFDIQADNFLVFENGPSESFTLQWATYKDAADQTSLSRIWGGIHPPEDDIKGRVIGEKIGTEAYNLALSYFTTPKVLHGDNILVAPNPFDNQISLESEIKKELVFELFNMQGQLVFNQYYPTFESKQKIDLKFLAPGMYVLMLTSKKNNYKKSKLIIKK